MYKNGHEPNNIFKYLLSKLRSKPAKHWVDRGDCYIELRLEFSSSIKTEIVTDYCLNEFELSERKTLRPLRRETSPLIKLIPYSKLIPYEQILKIHKRIISDEELQKFNVFITADPIEYATDSGGGISEQTLSVLFDNVKQEYFRLKKEINKLEKLQDTLIDSDPVLRDSPDKPKMKKLNTLTHEIYTKQLELESINREV